MSEVVADRPAWWVRNRFWLLGAIAVAVVGVLAFLVADPLGRADARGMCRGAALERLDSPPSATFDLQTERNGAGYLVTGAGEVGNVLTGTEAVTLRCVVSDAGHQTRVTDLQVSP